MTAPGKPGPEAPEIPAESPDTVGPLTRTILAGIAMRAGSRLLKQGVDRGILGAAPEVLKSAAKAAGGTPLSPLAIGTLSLGAVLGTVAAGAFAVLRLARHRYRAGEPLVPGAQHPTGTTADAPRRAAGSTGNGGSATDATGHVPTDLMRADPPGPGDRAVDAFRPDPTAPVPAAERDALRPALIPAGS